MNEQERKNVNELKYVLVVILIGFIVMAVALFRERAKKPIVKLVPVQAPIPSAREIQQRLTDLDNPRYDPGPIDGIPGPKMIRGWDNYVMDRYAKKAIEGR